MSMNFNPSELKEAILYRLPVKSLLRFRCVSKPWRSLTDDPYFIKLHLKQSIETNTNISLIIRERKLYSTDLDLVGKRKPEELDHPLNLKPSNTERFVVGSCNGLLCLVNRRNIVLWNMSTRKYHLLPDMSVPYPNFPKPDLHLEVYGFAYDSINDDYKVLSILNPEFYTDRCGLEPVVIIYSLRANTWRWIEFDSSYRCIFYCKQSGILSNGALHWIESGLEYRGFKCPRFLIAFDLAREEFRKVPLPDDSKGADRLQVLEGCLSVIKMDRNVGVDIWVMKVYGVKDSWTKLFSFAKEKMVYYSLSYPIPISYSKSGDKLLFHERCSINVLYWYDLKNEKFEKFSIPGWRNYCDYDLIVCPGSLVPLNAP